LSKRAGISLRPTFLPFTPWTTIEDYLDVLDSVEREDLIDHVDPVQYTIRLLIPPGSYLLNRPEMKEHLGALDQASFSYVWAHPDPRMDRLAHDVFGAVEKGATFAEVRALAEAAARRPPSAAGPIEHRRVRGRPPRLSESWFC